MTLTTFKRVFVGRPKSTAQAVHERLDKRTALAVFSSDALSSTAYATEEILLVLMAAVMFGQASGFSYIIPITIGIAILLAIVATSYRQTRSGIRSNARCSSQQWYRFEANEES